MSNLFFFDSILDERTKLLFPKNCERQCRSAFRPVLRDERMPFVANGKKDVTGAKPLPRYLLYICSAKAGNTNSC